MAGWRALLPSRGRRAGLLRSAGLLRRWAGRRLLSAIRSIRMGSLGGRRPLVVSGAAIGCGPTAVVPLQALPQRVLIDGLRGHLGAPHAFVVRTVLALAASSLGHDPLLGAGVVTS